MTTLPYEIVVGLEVHTQLKTRTKMFCSCPNRYGAEPNTLTCPVCTGQPGALPVANRQAFTLAMRVGLALNAQIARATKFDRKNYFYPDLPKGYQISQFDQPITADGFLALTSGKKIGIVRAHLEEDAGKSSHMESGAGSLVDLNRCGVPLLEIVSAPDLRSSAEAIEYLDSLKLLLRRIERFRAEAGPTTVAPDMPALSLEAILALLEADDVGAPVAWRGLASHLAGSADATLLKQLDTLIENFDFAAAAPLLRELIVAAEFTERHT